MHTGVLILLLPVCGGMVVPSTPVPESGCLYNGKHYNTWDVIHRSTEGDCVRTLFCGPGGPIAGDSRGCFTGHKRDERSSETGLLVTLPQLFVTPPQHHAMVGVPLSYNPREAEAIPSSNEPDTVGSRRSPPTNPEERSEGDNRADGDRALDYKEENVPLM